MKNSIFITAVFLFFATSIFAQKRKAIPEFDAYQKSITVELLGSHILHGINFDMRLKKGQMDGLGFRAGIGGISLSNTEGENSASLGLVTFPVEINHIVGKKRHGFISGVGILPVYGSIKGSGPDFDNSPIEVDGFGVVGGFATLGYRFSPLKNGFTWQINYNPLLIRGEGFQSWVGIQVGIGFK
jgi:hypothetical protein